MQKYQGELQSLRLIAFFQKHPALVLTTSYVLLSLMGLFYLAKFYSHFEIPVLYFIEITDLAAVGYREPRALLMLVLGLGLMVFVDFASKWSYNVQPRVRQMESKLLKRIIMPLIYTPKSANVVISMMLFCLIPYLMGFVFLAADHQAKKITTEKTVNFEIIAQDKRYDAYLLGTSFNFVFAYIPEKDKAEIFNVEEVTVMRPIIEPSETGKNAEQTETDVKIQEENDKDLNRQDPVDIDAADESTDEPSESTTGN
ncbi:MAG: hypothetical protein GJ680_14610 [Alteromonadaceae bacterium]|nr:hypothetical protein [Alteromonadaceae bacterium]